MGMTFPFRNVWRMSTTRTKGIFLVVGAFGQFEQRVFALFAIVKALHGRRGGAEKNGRAFHLAAHDGDITRMVTRSFFLLVTVLVLFIDNDKSKRIDGGKNG
jgi:hypothetical protein